MFCPRCSQEQVSDEIKFCSRCGFLLEDVSEALQNDGKVERNVIQSAKDFKKSALIGIIVLILSVKFMLLSLIFGTPEPSFIVQFNLLIGVLVFILGLSWIAYSFWIKPMMLRKQTEKENQPDGFPNSLEAKPTEKLLNEADLSQAVNYAAPQTSLTTGELVKTPSVTEDTTKNLRFDEK